MFSEVHDFELIAQQVNSLGEKVDALAKRVTDVELVKTRDWKRLCRLQRGRCRRSRRTGTRYIEAMRRREETV